MKASKNLISQKVATPKKLAVNLASVTKIYTLHHEKPTLVENFLGGKKSGKFTALDGVDLQIFQGEKIGIVGPNGSGKTTLLKVIAGITAPTTGVVQTFGKIVSLIDLTAGFHPDLNGRENIFLNGLVIGMTNSEIEAQFEKIVAFADIGKFIDEPIFTYSEGMKLRLGFSVAVHSDPDILILDEGIAAGDLDFQAKSGAKIEQMFEEDKTIIVVSHWLDYLKRHCERFFYFEAGKIKSSGDKNVLKLYEKNTLSQ